MIVTPHCKHFIQFKEWNVPTILKGTTRGNIRVQTSGEKYFSTNSTVLCPITNYDIDVLTGNITYINLVNTTGELNVKAVSEGYNLTITACSRNSFESVNCAMSPVIQLTVEEIDFFSLYPSSPTQEDQQSNLNKIQNIQQNQNGEISFEGVISSQEETTAVASQDQISLNGNNSVDFKI